MERYEQIIAEARSWVGTRFHHQGRCKRTRTHKGGVDCIGLLVGVGTALGMEIADKTDYARLPESGKLEAALDRYLMPKPLSEVLPGDVLLFTFEKAPQHVGIVSLLPDGELGLIHAYMEARGVVEHRLDQHWWNKAVAAYWL